MDDKWHASLHRKDSTLKTLWAQLYNVKKSITLLHHSIHFCPLEPESICLCFSSRLLAYMMPTDFAVVVLLFHAPLELNAEGITRTAIQHEINARALIIGTNDEAV